MTISPDRGVRGHPLSIRLLPLTAALLLAACGDGETTTTTTELRTATAATTVALDPRSEPGGLMTADGIGEASRGDSVGDVLRAFGEPASESAAGECEGAPILRITYRVGDGELVLNFAGASPRLRSYSTDSGSLRTDHGDGVGDTWQSLTRSWGAALDPVTASSNSEVRPGEGTYKVGLEGEGQLVFELEEGRIAAIAGGASTGCGAVSSVGA